MREFSPYGGTTTLWGRRKNWPVGSIASIILRALPPVGFTLRARYGGFRAARHARRRFVMVRSRKARGEDPTKTPLYRLRGLRRGKGQK
jgi:hypothetical protein